MANNNQWNSFHLNFYFLHPRRECLEQKRNPVKLDRIKNFDIYSCVLFDCYCQSLISGGETEHWDNDSTTIWDFSNTSQFPMILSLKALGNSWGNLCTKFFMVNTIFVIFVVNRTCTKTLQSSRIFWPWL